MIKVILGVAAAMVASSTQAQAPAAQGMSRQQAQQFADSMFQRLDTNHDGAVTRQEADAVVQAAGGRGHMIERTFGAAQSLTLPQFEAAALALFDADDSNHDGTVSAAEREQARALRAQQKQGQ